MTRRQIVVVLACVAAAGLTTFIGTLTLPAVDSGRFVVSQVAAATTGVQGRRPEPARPVGPPVAAGAGGGYRLEAPVPGKASGIERGLSLAVLLAVVNGRRRGDAR